MNRKLDLVQFKSDFIVVDTEVGRVLERMDKIREECGIISDPHYADFAFDYFDNNSVVVVLYTGFSEMESFRFPQSYLWNSDWEEDFRKEKLKEKEEREQALKKHRARMLQNKLDIIAKLEREVGALL